MNIINALQPETDLSAIAKELTSQLSEHNLWGQWRTLTKLVKEQRHSNSNPIAIARREKGFSIKQLSELTGHSLGQIRNAEHGGSVNVHLAMRLSEALGVPLAELFQLSVADTLA